MPEQKKTGLSWLSFLGLLGAGAVAAVTPAVQQVVSNHPAWSVGLLTAWGILGHFLEKPVTTPQ
jgi:hypothetical protein